MKVLLKIVIVSSLIVACHGREPIPFRRTSVTQPKVPATTIADSAAVNDEKEYPLAMVDNKTDPACGMPLSVGMYDTAHYKNKVIGFCSKGCKTAFLEKPSDYKLKLK